MSIKLFYISSTIANNDSTYYNGITNISINNNSNNITDNNNNANNYIDN